MAVVINRAIVIRSMAHETACGYLPYCHLDFLLGDFLVVAAFFFFVAVTFLAPLLFLPALFLVPKAASQPLAYFWFVPTRVIVTDEYLEFTDKQIN